MLPLLQMHPHMVPPSPNLDTLATSSTSDYVSMPAMDYRQTILSPYQRPFPIRISQPYQGVAPSHVGPYSLDHAHQLRRKTPNGTIDAGYDGSPTQLSLGPPPLKHMILPTPLGGSPSFLRSNSSISYLQNTTATLPSPSSNDLLNARNIDMTISKRPPETPDSFLQYGPTGMPKPSFPWQTAAQPMSNQFLNVYQPLMRAAECNVRAFCPPPVPIPESSVCGQTGLHQEYTTWNSGFPCIIPQPLHGYGSLDFSTYVSRADLNGHHQQGSMRNSGISYDFTQPPPHLELQGLTLDSERSIEYMFHSRQHIIQPSFREKALSQAHTNYVDLLSHLHTTRRLGQVKTNPGSVVPSRLLIYPKPPRPKYNEFYDIDQGTVHDFDKSINSTSLRNGQASRMWTQNLQDPPASSNTYRQGEDGVLGSAPSAPSVPSAVSLRVLDPEGLTSRVFSHSVNRIVPSGKPQPLVNAGISLDVLRSLCEQSNWEWVDGMLLGGCLQFGLGQYGGALKWFSRVVALNSSHVEAITNMAATMYCLGRQDEAEQHWMRVIKLRPDCLEAAEHLVGLLYKRRAQEAVEIINYVQQALSLKPKKSTHKTSLLVAGPFMHQIVNDRSPTDSKSTIANKDQMTDSNSSPYGSQHAADFASSGYALSGSENGRILALVHAKGTMLFSLKDVKRASEAFEEAVLISVGRRMKNIYDLVHKIHAVLSPEHNQLPLDDNSQFPVRPLLLPPERARQTAHLLFPSRGELPGLISVPDGPAKRAAVQTTSNALLSLAKIFQDAMAGGSPNASWVKRPSGVGDILALYYLSLSLQESPSTANNVGILLAGVQQASPLTSTIQTAMPTQPTLPGIVPGSGLALALAYYNYGLRLDPKHVHLHTNLGSLLKDIGQLDLAIQMYERAVACDGTFDIALTNLANAVKDRGRINDAIVYYRRAVDSNPGFAEAVCGLLTALNSVCDWRGRGGVLLASGQFDRWHVDDQGGLIDARTTMTESGLTRRVVDIVRQQLEEASQWGYNILQSSTMSALTQQLQRYCRIQGFVLDEKLQCWARKPWEGSRLLRLVERATRVIMWTWYHDQHLSGRRVASLHYLRPQLPPSLAVPSAPTVLPFHTFTSPLSAKDIRSISQRNATRIACSTLRSHWLPNTVYPPPPPPDPQLNIGYVSSDFNNHPLAHLMQSVFGLHDPQRIRACCYATTPSDKSVHRLQIEREAPVFRDVSSWSPESFIEQIIQDQIHILVNLNGYTRGARNEIFAARPAPIQMSFMGFAGTLGSEWCDYILADTTAIPPSTLRPWRDNVGIEDIFRDTDDDSAAEWMYSENIIFCRDTFFCCDHAQSSEEGERDMTWRAEEKRRWSMRKELFPTLLDDNIILANFNQLYKIEPTTFRSWLRILARTPNAVLWLLRFPELGEKNLRRTAEAWAGAEVASRLIFTDVAPKSQHIARARVCDLFLDTPECNAHTTAADVLWSSTPLLTFPRYPYKMCSRMAASILKGALPKSPDGQQTALELIAGSETEYEDSAVKLAGGLTYNLAETGYGEGNGRLAEMRRLLWQSKWDCALFNTSRWVRDVEVAYEEAWRRWVAGEGGDIYL